MDEWLAASADPDASAQTLERLRERGRSFDGETGRRAAIVAGASAALGNLLVADDAAMAVLEGSLEPRSAADVAAEAALAMDEAASPAHQLAGVQRRGLLRVAARDLLGLAATPRVTAELSDLAEGILSAALEVVAPPTPLSVVAMGKLGGRELNYVSDVDIIFVAGDGWQPATRRAGDLLRLVGTVTPAGRTYELDTSLRPEGKDGPLVRTLDAYHAYYERWAKRWEFQALLKARPVAGDAALGAAFTELIRPFVWPDRLDAEAVEEIQRMKGVVESSAQAGRGGEIDGLGAANVKLAPGGLRDIEFAVQLLQLVHGRHDETLRSPNTLDALESLAEGGYVGEEDARTFGGAYVFLRMVEHRLQLSNLRRTHSLPQAGSDRRRLARSLGFEDLEPFEGALRNVRGLVRTIHEKLFYRPLLARFAELSAADHLGTDGLDRNAARDRLTALGFRDPDGALRHLAALAGGVTRRGRLFRTVLPALLPTLADAPDPDSGLAALRSLADTMGESPFLLQTMRDNPPVADLLARILGSSEVVGRWLQRQPEVVRLLPDTAALQKGSTRADYERLVEGLRRRGDGGRTPDALRRLRRREFARIAIRDLAGMADVVDVATELTGLAEACLQATVDLVCEQIGNPRLQLAVIGLGKLGARELAYSSDLDVLLVAEPADLREDAEQAAEALLRALSGITAEGQAFQVDANLRPEGKQGALVRSLASYRSYYERWGEPWELQALTQARVVAGNPDVGAAFLASIRELVYQESPPAERLTAVRQMKARVERERGTTRPSRVRGVPGRAGAAQPRTDRVNIKLGPGGMSDVEWTVQLLQLAHGGRLPSLRQPGTLPGIIAARDEGLLDGDEAQWLTDGWSFLAGVRNALYLGGARDTSVLAATPEELELLARLLGYRRPGGQELREDVARTMRRIRKVHERRFYASPR